MGFKDEQEYQDLRSYVRDIADKLELRDWTTHLSREMASDGMDASMICTYGRKYVLIRLGEAFFGLTPEAKRQTIVHELIHVHFYSWRWAYNNLKYTLSPDMFRVIEGSIKDAEEFGVDAMADAIAPYLPLPVKPNRQRQKASMAQVDAKAVATGKDRVQSDASCTDEKQE